MEISVNLRETLLGKEPTDSYIVAKLPSEQSSARAT